MTICVIMPTTWAGERFLADTVTLQTLFKPLRSFLMRCFSRFKAPALIALSLGLAACSGGTPTLTTPVSAANAYFLTSDNSIVGVDLDNMEYARSVRTLPQATTSTPVDGSLDLGEVILDIDYRNSEGAIYALTRTGTQGRIIRIDPTNGALVRISTLVADGTSTAISLANISYSIDFNPVVDRLRIIGSDGTNLRADVLTGDTLVDTKITSNTITGSAYEDSFLSGGRSTRLLTLDVGTDALYLQNPPNAGTQTLVRPLLSGTDFTRVDGYDINPANNAGVAILTSGGAQRVYAINASAGSGNAATAIGNPPPLTGGVRYTALTLITAANPTVLALSRNNQLYSFNAEQPDQISTPVTISGLATPATEKVIAIDFRQSDRKLFALTSDSKLYSVDTAGVATAVSTLSPALATGVNYTMDFNPQMVGSTNRLQLIGDNDSNAIVDAETGIVTASTAVSGTPNPTVVAAAFSNNYRGNTSTRLLVIDRANASLSEQNLASTSTNPVVGALTSISTLGITLAGNAGLDISGRFNDNILLMAHGSEPGSSTLYRLNSSTTTTVTPTGIIGGSAGPMDLIDIAIRF